MVVVVVVVAVVVVVVAVAVGIFYHKQTTTCLMYLCEKFALLILLPLAVAQSVYMGAGVLLLLSLTRPGCLLVVHNKCTLARSLTHSHARTMHSQPS